MRFGVSLVALGVILVACGGPSAESTDGTAATPSSQVANGTAAAPATVAPTTATEPVFVPPDLGEAAMLTDLDGWLQSDVESLDQLRGQVVVVQFWTFGCFNCKNTLPYLIDLYAEYGGQGMEIVGVHSPEFEREKDPAAIVAAAESLGVTWPIALDTNKRNFFKWQGSPAYWPRTFVIDQDGRIRFDRIGEGAYDELELTVATLLAEA